MRCWACRCPTATTWWWAPRPRTLVALGYKPVGRDFPVFLHPDTHEEYALARTERKTAPGYQGFVFHASPDVTLEEDLARRDFTINAMARGADGALIDPYDGRPTSRPACCAMWARPSPRTRCASCAGPLRRALRLYGGARDHGADAPHESKTARSMPWCRSASGRNWRAA